uniref:Methyltransf_21 domain-containing protein n=1 Tax=Caenorhabditis tropicalis TaxID=1561998 RepID=A0A1I7TUG6_9PELO
MFVDSLVKLSSKIVAKCLVEDRYKNLDFSLLPSLSDQVFYEVINISSSNYLRVIAKETGLKLNLTRFNSIISPVSRNDLANLQLHDIQRLILDLGGFEDEFTVKTEEGTILDIIGILKTILNEESRKNLRKLIIEDYGGNFERKWVQKLAELLPNLQVLDFEVPSRDVTAVCR